LDNERDVPIAVSLDLVRAVTVEAHGQGKPVLAHPQYLDGLSVSVHGGVDVLVHVTELIERWPPDLLARAVKQNMALVPTLKLLPGMQVTTSRQISSDRCGNTALPEERSSSEPMWDLFQTTLRGRNISSCSRLE
jgi:hypothetical protein